MRNKSVGGLGTIKRKGEISIPNPCPGTPLTPNRPTSAPDGGVKLANYKVRVLYSNARLVSILLDVSGVLIWRISSRAYASLCVTLRKKPFKTINRKER